MWVSYSIAHYLSSIIYFLNANSHQPPPVPSTKVVSANGLRILCISELRGKLSQLNVLAAKYNANCIVHSGNFGFFDAGSVARISVKILRQIAVFSPLLDPKTLSNDAEEIKRTLHSSALSELDLFLSGSYRLNVPVYTIYGAAEDLTVIEKFRAGEYKVPNLHIIDETTTHLISTPSGQNIRLFGLGGSLVLHRLFDNGDGVSTIAGSPGVMWTTVLQMGQLIRTACKNFDPTEIRVFVSHPPPAREGLLAQLALSLKADFTISSGLHFIYGSSFNEFSVLPSFDHFKGILAASRAQFMEVWNAVKVQLLELVQSEPKQQQLLMTAIDVFEAMPSTANKPESDAQSESYLENAHKSMWHFNLCDSAYGALVLKIVNGKVATESYSDGFDFKHRLSAPASKPTTQLAATPQPITKTKPNPTSAPAGSLYASPAISSAPTKPSVKPSSAPVQPNAAATNTSTSSEPAPKEEKLPGIWIANGQNGEESVKAMFAEQDRPLIKSIVIKENFSQPDRMFALVYFQTPEEVSKAIEHVDQTLAGKVSVIRTYEPSTANSWGSKSNGTRTWEKGSSRGARGGYKGRGGPKGRGGSTSGAGSKVTASSSST